MPAAARRPIDVARRAAVDVLLAVDVDDAYSNLVLPDLLRRRQVSGRDAAFATELAYGALRWQGVLDVVASSASGRDVAQLDPPVRAVLRLGAYQLLQLRTPAHAAVHETVELARVVCGNRPVGLVNAVLRRVADRPWAQWLTSLAPADEPGRTAFRHGYPEWVAAAILDALGGDVAELGRALAEDRPTTHLVARPGRIARDELLADAGEGATPGPWSPYAVRMAHGDPGAIEAVRDGRAAVQDEGSQLVAIAAAAAPVDADAGRWLDVCAGPGGKAALLAGLHPRSGQLLCGDIQPHRARLVARTVAGGAHVVVADGTRPAWRLGAFDRVLVDAPCTGLGALRRRPEVRWRRRPEDVARLAELQVALLRDAVAAVRPGGLVAYATCSPVLAETREVVDRVRRETGAVTVDARPSLGAVPDVGGGPHAQLWPHRHGTDAMYLALLRTTRA